MLIAAITLNILIILVQISRYSSLKAPKIPKIFYILGDVKEDSSRLSNSAEFKYIISKPKCSRGSSAPYFVTLVHTSPTRFERRIASRDTWAHADSRTLTYFLMGMTNSSKVQNRINEEEEEFNDIIQGNFMDSYRNMTYKHIMALKWFSDNCPHVKYLVKLDDDVFVNIPAIYQYLITNEQSINYIHGVKAGRTVFRTGKWKVTPEEFKDDLYPEFVEGSAVIYPNTFVIDAYKQTFIEPFFWIDDVFVTGIIRMQLNVRIQSISHLKMNINILEKITNGSLTKLPFPMFLITQHNRQYDDVLKLWDMTESFRESLRPNETSYFEKIKNLFI